MENTKSDSVSFSLIPECNQVYIFLNCTKYINMSYSKLSYVGGPLPVSLLPHAGVQV